MNTWKAKRGEEGVVLLVTLGFLIAMMIIIGYTAARALSHGDQMQQSNDYDQAFLALEGAQARILAASNNGNEAYIGLPGVANNANDPADYRFIDRTGPTPVLNLPPADDAAALAAGINWVPMGFLSNGSQISYVAVAVPGPIDGADNDTDGTVDDADGSEAGFTSYYMASRVTRNGSVMAYRAAEDTNAPGQNVNVWQNAIFADVGQGGALINGNVSIHGSVHLLGNNPNVPVVQALDMSGTSFIHNTYGQIGTNNGGIPADLAARINYTGNPGDPDFDYVDWDGDNNADEFTLNATLRIKNGVIDLGGNSEIGTSSGGDNEKLTMDGVYIQDGGGDEVQSGEDKIFSDNGFDQAYDLGDLVEFPTYDDDGGEVFITERYLEDFNETQWTEPDGTVHLVPNPGTNRVLKQDLILTAGPPNKQNPYGNSFYWNASEDSNTVPDGGIAGSEPGTNNMPTLADIYVNGTDISGGLTDAYKDDNFIWYDSSNNKLIVNGRVPVDGDVLLGSGNGQNDTYEYEGKGTLLAVDLEGDGVGGNTNVDANLVTTNFPHTNLLGMMSQNDFNVGDSSQKDIMGGFYAQGTVSLNYQSNIIGTIVGNFFNMGSQVPNIYQVPSLAQNWVAQQQMIGARPIMQPVKIGWREYNVRLENPAN